jgi:ATP-dependent helicase HrpA
MQPSQRATIARAADRLERAGLRAWPDHLPEGVLPQTFEESVDGHRVVGFPALVDEGERGVAQRVLGSREEQAQAMPLGTRRLLLLAVPSPAKAVLARLPAGTKLALATAPHAGASALFDDCLAAAVDALVEARGGPAWERAGFERLAAAVRGGLEAEVTDVVTRVALILSAAGEVERRLRGTSSLVVLPALTDVRAQLTALVHPGFVAGTGRARLDDVLRYLRAAARRLETLPEHPERDRQLMWRVELVQQSYEDALAAVPPGRPVPPELAQVRWMIEELRVSFFAQQLGTPYPVSEKRIQKVLAPFLTR